MKAFPARLPQQPIFYPVLQLEYARRIASGWNAKSGQSAGYVTQFKVEDQYIRQFETHPAGESQHQELWIPEEEIEEFNKHISGHIKLLEAHFGEAFQGFVPEQFGLQGKNAVEQFTMLTNSYLYKRMDFYREIRRSHKAVFLNYPFWQKYEFKNPGLKEKILQAIKEAWLTSFPQIPLPLPVPVDAPLAKQTHSEEHAQHSEDSVQRDILTEDEADAFALRKSVYEKFPPLNQTYANSLVDPVQENVPPQEQTASLSMNPVPQTASPPAQIDSHFVTGIKLGLRGNYRAAIDELSQTVEEEPSHVIAHTSLGVAYHRLGEDDRALACYETALKIDPIQAETHYFRANILYSHGSVREAIAAYTVAIGLKPELIEAHQKPSPEDRLTDYTGSPAEMVWIARPAHRILRLNKSLESNPEQANLLKERAAEYHRLRNYVQAIADYSSSLAIQPEDPSALHARGAAYEGLGQNDRAFEDYQRALAVHPQLVDMYIERGVTFGRTGNFRQSVASLTDAIRLAPKNPDGYFNRGMSYFQLGEFERAIADFSMAIGLSSNNEDAYYWRGVSNEEAGHQREATADYRHFLTISRNPDASAEIEQKLREWHEEERRDARERSVAPDDRQGTDQFQSEKRGQEPDLFDLITTLGERALHSTWFGSGVNCQGEKAEELYAFTDQNRPIHGDDLLRITSGIRKTIQGDFQAFEPDIKSHWIFIRAWEGSGFYIEINDPRGKERLKTHFPSAEEVDGAPPPYEGLFIQL